MFRRYMSNLKGVKVAAFLVFSLVMSGVICSDVYAENGYLVEYSEETGRISLDISNTSLKRVLQDISSRTGVTVFFDPETEKQVTLKVKDIELDKGLKRLIAPGSHAMVYERLINTQGQEEVRLKKISVFKEGDGETEELLVNKGYSNSEDRLSGRETERKSDSYVPPEERANLSKEERDAIKNRRRASRLERKAEKKARRNSSKTATPRK